MAKRLRITVDGEVFEVTVEEMGAEEVSRPTPKPAPKAESKPTPKPEPKPEPAAAPAPSGGQGSEKVLAPLAGTIRSIHAKVGDKVSSGDTLLTLEALKLENEIVAPIDGVVASIDVSSGDTVENGAILVTLNPA